MLGNFSVAGLELGIRSCENRYVIILLFIWSKFCIFNYKIGQIQYEYLQIKYTYLN